MMHSQKGTAGHMAVHPEDSDSAYSEREDGDSSTDSEGEESVDHKEEGEEGDGLGDAAPPQGGRARKHAKKKQEKTLTPEHAAELMRPPLSPPEVAEVTAILSLTLQRLALVSSITMDAGEQAEDLTRSVGDEISRLMQEQQELEKRFEVLIQTRAALKSLPNKSKLVESAREMHAVAVQLRESTKALRRNLKDNPNVAENMLKISQERAQLYALLAVLLQEVQEPGGHFPHLLATIEEEEVAERRVQQAVEREKAVTAEVRALTLTLKREATTHEAEIRERHKTMTTLKEKLKEMKHRMGMEMKYKSKEAVAGATCRRSVRQQQLSALEEEIAGLRAQIEVEEKVHAETVEFLCKRNTRLREEAIKWAAKHEADTQRLDKELEELQEAKQRDHQMLMELEARYKADMQAQALLDAKAAREAELAVLMQGTIELQTKAALKIQKVWRGWRVRNSLHGGKKGKKGKGGKKGKDGKKKKGK